MNSDFDVAVHAMVFLHHKGTTLRSEELAENVCTNAGRIRRVMAQLKKAGLVDTREGRFSGGYSYEKTRHVTLGDIGRALDVKYVDVGWHSGGAEMKCKIASGMAGYMDELYQALNQKCFAHLDTITVAEVEHTFFKEHTPEKMD